MSSERHFVIDHQLQEILESNGSGDKFTFPLFPSADESRACTRWNHIDILTR